MQNQPKSRNKVVEDLLKRPGLSVGTDGTIKANQEVEK
jgi:hypothetical protein